MKSKGKKNLFAFQALIITGKFHFNQCEGMSQMEFPIHVRIREGCKVFWRIRICRSVDFKNSFYRPTFLLFLLNSSYMVAFSGAFLSQNKKIFFNIEGASTFFSVIWLLRYQLCNEDSKQKPALPEK